MSRAEIDLLLFAIDQSDEALHAFATDPRAFLRTWEADHSQRDAGRWLGGELTDEERAAFVVWDYATLYRLGAHPSLLWQLVRALASDRDIGEVVAEYRREITPHGRPPFGT